MDDLPASPNDDNKSIHSTASISPLSFALPILPSSTTINSPSTSITNPNPYSSSFSTSFSTSTVVPPTGTNPRIPNEIPLPPLPTQITESLTSLSTRDDEPNGQEYNVSSSSSGSLASLPPRNDERPLRMASTTTTTDTAPKDNPSTILTHQPVSQENLLPSSVRSAKHGPSSSSSSPTPTILPVPPLVQLPSVPLPLTSTIDIRSGDHGWRNIPDVLRDSIAILIDSNKQLVQNQNILLTTVGRRAGHTEVASALANKVNTTQLSALTRYIQTDILKKLDTPCSGHTTTNRQVSTVITRLNTLESLVEAHDKAVVSSTKEMTTIKQNLEKHAYVTIPMLERKLNQTVSTLATVNMLDQNKQSTIDEIKQYTETSLLQKADILTVKALVNDMHILTNAMEVFEKTLQYPFVKSTHETNTNNYDGSSTASTLTNIFMQHLNETIQEQIQTTTHALQQQISTVNKKLQFLYAEQGNGNDGLTGTDDVPYQPTNGSRSILHKHTGTGGGPNPSQHSLPSWSETPNPHPHPSSSNGKNPLTTIVENTVKSKVANLNIAIEKQIHNQRHEYETKLKQEMETINEELSNALKTKLNKTDFTKAITARPTIDMVQDLLKSEIQTIDTSVKKKADQVEVSALKRSIMNIENALLQYQIIKSTQDLNGGLRVTEPTLMSSPTIDPVDTHGTLATADALSSLKGQITALASKTEAQYSALQAHQHTFERLLQQQRQEIEESLASRIDTLVQSSLQKYLHPTIQEQIQAQIMTTGPNVHPKEMEDVRSLVTQLYQRIDSIDQRIHITMENVQGLLSGTNPGKTTSSSSSNKGGNKVGILHNQSDLSHLPSKLSSATVPPTVPSIPPYLTGRWVWKNRRLVPYTGPINPVLRFVSSSSSSGLTDLNTSMVSTVSTADSFNTTNTNIYNNNYPHPTDKLPTTDAIRIGAIGLVVFDLQPIVPTNKDLFTWISSSSSSSSSSSVGPIREIDRTVITTTVPGLYKLSLGFFALVLPMLTVLVDNQPVLSTVLSETVKEGQRNEPSSMDALLNRNTTSEDNDISNISADTEMIMDNLLNQPSSVTPTETSNEKGSSSLVTVVPIENGATVVGSARILVSAGSTSTVNNRNHGGGQLIIHKHPAGSVAGITVNYYLALPANARLSILYAGQTRGQGFMELTKL